MPAKVADASVIAALAFNEPRAEEAASLLADVVLFEPALLPFELLSVARKKTLLHPEDRGRIEQGLVLALSLPIEWVDIDPASVLSLALDAGLSTYDATYLHLAHRLRIPLVTFDRVLGSAAAER